MNSTNIHDLPIDPKVEKKGYMKRRKQTNIANNTDMLIQSDDNIWTSLSKVYRYSEPGVPGSRFNL